MIDDNNFTKCLSSFEELPKNGSSNVVKNPLSSSGGSISNLVHILKPHTQKLAVTPENIDKVHDIVLINRPVKVLKLAEAVGILIDWVHFILQHDLYMKKLCTKWVLRFFTLLNYYIYITDRGDKP